MPTHTPSRALELARDQLRSHAESITEDPQTNSVFATARGFFRRLEDGEADLAGMEALVDEVHLALALDRAEAFRSQHEDVAPDQVWARLRQRLETLADAGWETFARELETPAGGLVLTAHPTFALSLEAREALARQAELPGAASRKTLKHALEADGRAWAASISLEGEHSETQAVLTHAQAAMAEYAALVFQVASEKFPDRFTQLNPALPTLASWVGYDLDGRTDIQWWQSFALRLSEKAVQLDRYGARVATLAKAAASEPLADLAERLQRAADAARAGAKAFSKDLSQPQLLVDAAQLLTADAPDRITDIAEVIAALDSVLAGADVGLATQLCALRAEMAALQLGTARIHLRVNAAQVRAVISRDLGLETEDRDLGRVALQRLSEKAAESGVRQADFAELFLERSTARRQIMMCALMLEHIDAGSDIRFLIAESENPATVMGALYLARQHGVDHKLDISPLFETPEALETGGRFIQRLLEEPEFLAYLHTRGHLSIQLGFSDAGRFIGQIAADMAIERIHNLIIRALAAKDASLGLLIFNTHGESMGRGAWPGSFAQRFDHVLTPWTRCQARARGLRLRHEVSFQGGDGFMHFQSPALAAVTYGNYCEHLLSEPADCSADPFYTETGFVWDTYRSLRAWHERLFGEADYGRLLSDFATNFLVRAGSRQRRRSGGPTGPRALRAISHNATLQQLGAPVNTAAGIGSAIRRETERLITLINGSVRMRSLVNLALRARMTTSIPALRAYASVYDPSFWVAIARQGEPAAAVAYRRVFYSLQAGETFLSICRVADRFSLDLHKFDRLLAELDDAPRPEERHEERLDLHVLHAVRLALMMRVLSLAGQIPTLSGRHDASLQDLMDLAREMRIGELASLLEQVFPASSPEISKLREISGTAASESQGYDQVHDDIITPLKTIDRLMHKLTLAVAQAYRAYG
ncbi:MAG: phosphoenolpyruvate carboxylase [Hyphomonadaceae bacterium]|nr:phosphoenolpyruvate carboxylase [Hyphomonadaceae bacterium]